MPVLILARILINIVTFDLLLFYICCVMDLMLYNYCSKYSMYSFIDTASLKCSVMPALPAFFHVCINYKFTLTWIQCDLLTSYYQNNVQYVTYSVSVELIFTKYSTNKAMKFHPNILIFCRDTFWSNENQLTILFNLILAHFPKHIYSRLLSNDYNINGVFILNTYNEYIFILLIVINP